MQKHRKSSGYAMMELLVAIALAAAGLLGFAKLQHRNFSLEQDLMMQIHGNLLLSEVAGVLGDTRLCLSMSTSGNIVPVAPDCRTDDCTKENFAAFQLMQWQCRVSGHSDSCDRPEAQYRLPHPASLVIRPQNSQAVIQLNWRSSDGTQTSIARTVRPASQC